MLEFVSSANFSREVTSSLLYFHLVVHALNFEKKSTVNTYLYKFLFSFIKAKCVSRFTYIDCQCGVTGIADRPDGGRSENLG